MGSPREREREGSLSRASSPRRSSRQLRNYRTAEKKKISLWQSETRDFYRDDAPWIFIRDNLTRAANMLHVVRLHAAITGGRYRRAVVKIGAINPSASDESINAGSLYDSTIRLPRSWQDDNCYRRLGLIAYLFHFDFRTPSPVRRNLCVWEREKLYFL